MKSVPFLFLVLVVVSTAVFAIQPPRYVQTAGKNRRRLLLSKNHKIGPEFRISTQTTHDQSYPNVGTFDDGKFVVAWESFEQDGSETGVYGQRYNADGTKIGSEFRVNTYTAGKQHSPNIGTFSNGKFIVVWQSVGQDGSDSGVYGQRYNADGTKLNSEFRVNTYTTDDQTLPCVGTFSNGKFVVAWDSFGQDGSESGVYGQLYNADGTKLNSEFRVNTYTAGKQHNSNVESFSDGKFIVVWQSFGQDDSNYGVYGQRYNADGTKLNSEFRINTYTTGVQWLPSVGTFSDGKFVVAWDRFGQDGSESGVYGQMYNADGTRLNSEFLIHEYGTDRRPNPNIGTFDDGKFIIAWSGLCKNDNVGICGQQYEANGTKFGSEFLVNTHISNKQELPSVGTLSDGKFVVVWSSNAQDDSGDGVYGQLFNFGIPGKPTTPSTTSSPTPSSTIPSADASVASCLPSDYFSLLGSFFVTGILALMGDM